jgi:hypothetical protein
MLVHKHEKKNNFQLKYIAIFKKERNTDMKVETLPCTYIAETREEAEMKCFVTQTDLTDKLIFVISTERWFSFLFSSWSNSTLLMLFPIFIAAVFSTSTMILTFTRAYFFLVAFGLYLFYAVRCSRGFGAQVVFHHFPD